VGILKLSIEEIVGDVFKSFTSSAEYRKGFKSLAGEAGCFFL
jgi:hypothetical protein